MDIYGILETVFRQKRFAAEALSLGFGQPQKRLTTDDQRLYAESRGSNKKRKKVQKVERRRKVDDGDRQRADTPQRRKPAAQPASAPRPSTPRPQASPRPQGGGQPPSMPSLPAGLSLGGGKRPSMMMIVLLVVGAICIIGFFLMSGGLGDLGGGGGLPQAPIQAVEPTQPFDARVQATSTTRPFTPPAVSDDGSTWLIMLYADADDKILEQDIYLDLNEVERVGSTDQVQIVAQVDRYRAGFSGDGNWSSAKRFYITRDDDLGRVSSQEVADLGEVNMADGATLVDFATWAIETFPADKHVLIMSDHGMGWPGGWSDPAPGGAGDRSIPLAARLGDELYLMELDQALGEVRARTGLDKFELIGMDACLMSHLEVYAALAPHARFAVASQEVEPAVGWAYKGFLETLVASPGMDGGDLGKLIVDSYIRDDQRIVDPQARAEFLKQGSPMGGLFGGLFGGGPSAEQLAQQMSRGTTLSAIDLQAMSQLMAEFNNLVFALQEEDQSTVAQARSHAQSYTSIFGKEVPASYIDLGHFVQLLKRQVRSANVSAAIDGVLAALGQTVVAEKHGPDKPGSNGISIYYPNSQLYSQPTTGPQSYTAIAKRFAEVSLWDDFLAFHYTGRRFEAAAGPVMPPVDNQAISAPGAGQVQVSTLLVSDSVATPDSPVVLSADVQGSNLGYIYLFLGFFDSQSNSILIADRDYLESVDTREINGVYYPVWGEEPFTLEFEWDPVVFAVSDGVNHVTALFTPESYGRSYEEAIYTVEGTYTYADSGETRYVRLYFQDGLLRHVYGFTQDDGSGAPREIIPQAGDTFTVLEKWMDLDAQGKVVQIASQEGGTLTFGDQMFTWVALDAPVGEFMVGFIVEDLDGQATEAFTQVSVR
ncbi:clostripain-related cysteine peptidase [Chloroflexota bacterium]